MNVQKLTKIYNDISRKKYSKHICDKELLNLGDSFLDFNKIIIPIKIT